MVACHCRRWFICLLAIASCPLGAFGEPQGAVSETRGREPGAPVKRELEIAAVLASWRDREGRLSSLHLEYDTARTEDKVDRRSRETASESAVANRDPATVDAATHTTLDIDSRKNMYFKIVGPRNIGRGTIEDSPYEATFEQLLSDG
jgi:hypothetical protein